jgi:hypothetical protein
MLNFRLVRIGLAALALASLSTGCLWRHHHHHHYRAAEAASFVQ